MTRAKPRSHSEALWRELSQRNQPQPAREPTHTTPGGRIELIGLARTYDKDHTTGLRDATCVIEPGEFVAIVGPSGAGKSTLLNVLGLLDRATAGHYLLDGVDVEQLSEATRNRTRSTMFGYVFQSAFVLGDQSVLHNAAMGLRTQAIPLRERSRRAAQALRRVGLTNLTSGTARLVSGGERQRLAIARAIAPAPRVILADEPTGNLDTRNSWQIIELLQSLNREGATVIVVTHDDNVARTAGRRLSVVDGILTDETSPISSDVTADTRPLRLPLSPDLPPSPPDNLSPPEAPLPAATRPRRVRRAATTAADDLAEAASAHAHRPLRTALLALAFALGIGGLIASIGITESAAAQVSERLTQAALDEVRVALPGGPDLLQAGDDRLAKWIEAADNLPHTQAVGYLARTGTASAQIRRLAPDGPPPTSDVVLVAASPSYLDMMGADITGPGTTTLLDDPAFPNIAVIGERAAAGLDTAAPGPGSRLWIAGEPINIVGKIQASNRDLNLEQAIVASPDVLAAMPEVDVTLVIRTDQGFPAAVAEALPLALDPTEPGAFRVETVADLRDLRFGVASDLGSYVGILSAILLALAAISAATTMYLTVLSRGPEIALRRAIGASRASIVRLFIIEGIIIGILGGALGVALGTTGALLGARAQHWSPVLPAHLTPLGLALGLATGVLAALIPAWTAGRRDPATAIRG